MKNRLIEIEANETKGFSLLTRFQQLDSLYEKCGTGSMNEFLIDVINNGKIIFIGKNSTDVLLNGKRSKFVKKLQVVKIQKIEIIEPSNLD